MQTVKSVGLVNKNALSSASIENMAVRRTAQSRVFPVPNPVHGSASIKENAICHVGHHATDCHATGVAPRHLHVAVAVLLFAERNAPQLIFVMCMGALESKKWSVILLIWTLLSSSALQEVDMIIFRKYGDLTDEELTQDPLIVLSCGHAFLTSTLDAHMGITEFYQKDRLGR